MVDDVAIDNREVARGERATIEYPILFIYFLNILFIYLAPLSLSCGMRDLAPPPGIEPGAPRTQSMES